MRRTPLAILLFVVLAPGAARAQVVFPPDAAYVPLRCGAAPMADPFADETGALDERDLVGDGDAPAGLRAADATNLYLRMRLEEDPSPAGAARPFSWGMEFDLDNDLNDYELLVLVDGLGGAATVKVFTNTTTTAPNDLNDPADLPAAAMFAFAMNARSVPASGTTNGGSPDFFLEFAVPWSTLVPLGLDRATMTHVWAATSSSGNSLNGDVACHDGSTGPAQLTGTASDPTTGDPAFDPIGGGPGRLEGGGGCATTGGTAWLAIALLGLVWRRISSVRHRRASDLDRRR